MDKFQKVKQSRGSLYIRVDNSLYFEREIIHGTTRGMMLYYEKGVKICWVCPFLWNVEAWNKDALT